MTERKQYYREIRRALNGSPKYKANVLTSLKLDVDTFCQEHPSATMADIRQFFGEPADYAKEYSATMTQEELGQKLAKVSFHKRLWATTAALIVLIVAALAIQIGIHNHRATANHSIITTYEIRAEKEGIQ